MINNQLRKSIVIKAPDLNASFVVILVDGQGPSFAKVKVSTHSVAKFIRRYFSR
jgi:hypothetical protein